MRNNTSGLTTKVFSLKLKKVYVEPVTHFGRADNMNDAPVCLSFF